jgi:hypothetical protein
VLAIPGQELSAKAPARFGEGQSGVSHSFV